MKKNLIILSIFLSLTALFWLSCQKEENSCLACEPCEEFVSLNILKAIDILPDRELTPCFNPNNNNEFIYIKERESIYSLVKYDIAQAKETLILDKINVSGKPRWGKNNRIVFIDENSFKINIYDMNTKTLKVYEDSEFLYLFPCWKNDSIIVVNASTGLSTPSYYAEINIHTNKRDTIKDKFRMFDFNVKEESCYYDGSVIQYKQGEKTTDLFNYRAGVNLIDFSWHPNSNDIYYTTTEGLFKVNKESKKLVQLKKSCSSKCYHVFSISPDGKTILAEKEDTWQENATVLPKRDISIWIMDIDGRNEVKLFQ